MTRFLLLAGLLLAGAAACKGKHEKRKEQVAEHGSGALPPDSPCQQLPFADASTVPEASGAAWLPVSGKLQLVVISDSGNSGAYAVVDPETGETTESGRLPLGAAGDDIEGASAWNDQLATVSSSGWMRIYKRDDAARGWVMVGEAYPLGEVNLPDKSDGNHPPQGDGMVCGAKATNCGRNYEGLCLVDAAHRNGACVGFAAAKADGKLYCLTEEGGKLVAQHDRAIAITRPGALADCAFADDGSLWAGSNLFDLGNVYAVTGWDNPATAKATVLAPIGVGFPETLAVRGDVFYRMSDTGGSPSLMSKYRCKR